MSGTSAPTTSNVWIRSVSHWHALKALTALRDSSARTESVYQLLQSETTVDTAMSGLPAKKTTNAPSTSVFLWLVPIVQIAQLTTCAMQANAFQVHGLDKKEVTVMHGLNAMLKISVWIENVFHLSVQEPLIAPLDIHVTKGLVFRLVTATLEEDTVMLKTNVTFSTNVLIVNAFGNEKKEV